MNLFTRRGPKLILAAVSLGISLMACLPANAVEYNGVRRVITGKHQGVVTSVFVQPDPAFSGDTLNAPFNIFGPINGNTPSYSSTLDQFLNPGGTTGVNIPSLETGQFPSTGNFQALQYHYSIPGNGNADAGLTFVVQTADGLFHSSNFATTGSDNLGTNNGRRQRRVLITNINAFTPPLTATGTGSRIRQAAVVFEGSGAGNTINLVFPPAFSPTVQSFFFLLNSNSILYEDPRIPGSLASFDPRVSPPDPRFNFEF